MCCSFNESDIERLQLCVLQSFVERRTGIPRGLMKFMYQNKQVQTRDSLISLPSGANLHLKLALLGGHNCDMCFASATMHCEACDQFFLF